MKRSVGFMALVFIVGLSACTSDDIQIGLDAIPFYRVILSSPVEPDSYPFVQTINRDLHDVEVSQRTEKWAPSFAAKVIPPPPPYQAAAPKPRTMLAVPAQGGRSFYGNVAHYSTGTNSMANVSRRRGMPIVAHMCSSPYLRSDYLGRWITVYSHETKRSFSCRITDVSADEHRAAQLAGGLVLEVDFYTARQFWGVEYVGEEPNKWNWATIYIN